MNEKILELLEEKKIAELKTLLGEMNPADIATLLSLLSEDHLPIIFRILPKELAAETFAYIDGDIQEILITAFSDKELKEVIDNLFLDDTVDLIEEMPASVVKRILRHTQPEKRRKINELLNYPKDSAGSIMTIEYIDLKKNMTVQNAFSRIRRTGINKETIYTCYVTNEKRELIGTVSVKDLLLAEYEDTIGEIMETKPIYVSTHEDQEEVAKYFDKYDLLALPVVDKEERLVGIITIDDAMDVLQEENTEDMEVMAAITPTDKPYMKTGVFETWKKRIPWLLLLMISATFTGRIITYYEAALGAYVILTAYIPMLMDTGGNAGSQTSVTIIRGLSLGEINYKDIFKIVGKELLVSLCCGITLALANFAKLMILDKVGLSISLIVCTTLVATVIVAKLVGCSLPILAKRIGFDPAVMASPFITTIVDAISLIIYFQVASYTLGI